MKEIVADIFEALHNGECDAGCVTTNNCVKANGELVMGKGIAWEAKRRYPELPRKLAEHVRTKGNIPELIYVTEKKLKIISLPTKTFWRNKSDIELVLASLRHIVKMTDEQGWQKVYLPRPGCGCGQLNWKEVKPKIEELLDDRFYICTLD